MINKPKKPSRERMIHIRLDAATHRSLKVYAANKGTTMQRLVEDLIRRKFLNRHTGDALL